MTPVELAIVALLAGGVFFAFVAAVGVLRLPDLYTRTHAASKSDTLGAVLGLGAVALVFGAELSTVKAVFLLVFMFVTNPTAAHAIARAAFDQDIEPWTNEDAERTTRGADADRSPEDADGSESVATDGGSASDASGTSSGAKRTDGGSASGTDSADVPVGSTAADGGDR